ncbi:caax amino terminal protease family protein [Anaeramoeba flamelloides]|uniref:Caax amino terminal protease family protein n=1 Tax=Anaeramoeba flamelloides TaxID=1746091 RepID=A0ABQ8XQ68_9EUKA|nr:caax amino terminal protease family protein [Anaeramoeba flamelloides]
MNKEAYEVYRCRGEFKKDLDSEKFVVGLPKMPVSEKRDLYVEGLQRDMIDESQNVVVILVPPNSEPSNQALDLLNNPNQSSGSRERQNEFGLPSTETGLFLTLIGFVIIFVISNFFQSLNLTGDPNQQLLISLIGTAMLLSGPMFYIRKHNVNVKACLRLQKGQSTKSDYLYGSLLTFFTQIVILLWYLWKISTQNKEDNDNVDDNDNSNNLSDENQNTSLITDLLSFLSVVIIPGILEELTFRGFFQKTLEQKYSIRKSILISSFIFSFVHFDFSIFGFFYRFAFGFFYGSIASKTDSCYPSSFCHMMNNMMLFIFSYTHDYWNEKISRSMIFPLIFISIIITCLLIYVIRIWFKRSIRLQRNSLMEH